MSNKSIYVTKPSLPPFEEYVKEIASIWDSGILTNMGEKHKKLEDKLQSMLETNNISLYVNGHMALEAAIMAFKLSGEIITTPFTFISTTQAISRCGIKPVFCDIRYDNYTIDSKKIEKLINKKTSAIIPVHVYGNICDYEEIEKIANKYNLKVIYDAAHAFGVKIDKVGVGNLGDASMFSFHATKVFNTIEGGAITYKDNKIKDKLNSIKNFGYSNNDSVNMIGFNAKMNEFQAAMGLCNLKYVKSNIKKREVLAKKYDNNLKNIKGIKLNSAQNGIKGNYSYYPIVFEEYKYSRDEIYEKLIQNNIFSRKYFYPLTNAFEYYRDKYKNVKNPIAEFVSKNILTLPMYSELDEKIVDKICNIITGI